MTYLSYSGWKTYKGCPCAYCHKSVLRTAPVVPDNRINSIYGSTIGALAEQFYKDRVWRSASPNADMVSRAAPTLDETIERERAKSAEEALKFGADADVWRQGCIRWEDKRANYHSRESLLADVEAAADRLVDIIRLNRLLGPRVGTEVVLDAMFGPHTLLGRADFIIRHLEPAETQILDGKGSRWRERYVDPEQLNWYAFLWRKRTGRLPDKMGFVYWRSDPERALDWHTASLAEIDGMEADVLADVETIETGSLQYHTAKEPEHRLQILQEQFPVHPGSGCQLCAYVPVCPAGQIMTTKTQKSPNEPFAGVEEAGL